MKRILNWQFFLGLTLVVLSAAVYYVHFLIFRDAHHIFIYLVGDIAFVFLEVLLVTLILHQLLNYRHKKDLLNKMNMSIGMFFSEMGIELLFMFSAFDPGLSNLLKKLKMNNTWTDRKFSEVRKRFQHRNCDTSVITSNDFEQLRTFLKSKRSFMLMLLGNPNLMEHQVFTDLLWAVFHLTEELIHRKDIRDLPKTDLDHLSGDIERAYTRLFGEWIKYMRHLKNNYPYLFSLAVRTNPFDKSACIEVKG